MRPPILYLAIGRKRSGKSRRTLEILRQYVTLGRKCLIFDTQDEYVGPEYMDIRTLSYTQVSLFSQHPEISIRRIPPFHFSGNEFTPDEKAVIVQHILNHFRSGLLLLEDINDYLYDYMPMDIVGKVLSQRHKAMDIVMHFHSLGAVQKKIWRHINVIRLHKCEDSVEDNKDKFPEKYELFKIAELIVNDQYNQGNEFFSLEIMVTERKIVGGFADADRDKAIEDYLSLRYVKLIKPYLTRVSLHQDKEYTKETAFQAELQRLRTTYFNA